MATNKTTVWAIVAGEVAAVAVTSTLRNEIEPALRAAGGHGAEACFFAHVQAGAFVAWGWSQASAEGRCGYLDVPVEVREACALWLPGWAGRLCAQDWHDEEPSEIQPGETFERWRMGQAAGLPARGDLDFLARATCALLGRDPSESERRAFGEALLATLFALSPEASDDDADAA